MGDLFLAYIRIFYYIFKTMPRRVDKVVKNKKVRDFVEKKTTQFLELKRRKTPIRTFYATLLGGASAIKRYIVGLFSMNIFAIFGVRRLGITYTLPVCLVVVGVGLVISDGVGFAMSEGTYSILPEFIHNTLLPQRFIDWFKPINYIIVESVTEASKIPEVSMALQSMNMDPQLRTQEVWGDFFKKVKYMKELSPRHVYELADALHKINIDLIHELKLKDIRVTPEFTKEIEATSHFLRKFHGAGKIRKRYMGNLDGYKKELMDLDHSNSHVMHAWQMGILTGNMELGSYDGPYQNEV